MMMKNLRITANLKARLVIRRNGMIKKYAKILIAKHFSYSLTYNVKF